MCSVGCVFVGGIGVRSHTDARTRCHPSNRSVASISYHPSGYHEVKTTRHHEGAIELIGQRTKQPYRPFILMACLRMPTGHSRDSWEEKGSQFKQKIVRKGVLSGASGISSVGVRTHVTV